MGRGNVQCESQVSLDEFPEEICCQSDDTMDPPTDPKNVRIDYRAAIEGRRAVVIDGGWTRDEDVTIRRRIAYRATDFDYAVEIEGRTALETTLEK